MKTFGMGIALFLLRIIFLPILLVSIAWTPVDVLVWLLSGKTFFVYDRAATVMRWFCTPLRFENGIFWQKVYNKDTEF